MNELGERKRERERERESSFEDIFQPLLFALFLLLLILLLLRLLFFVANFYLLCFLMSSQPVTILSLRSTATTSITAIKKKLEALLA